MCGIAGFLDRCAARDRREMEALAAAMAATLTHRGPDDAGVWADPDSGVALGHRRLSILDLSAEGRQPMVSRSGRYVLVYNGEVYNFRELRAELSGESFRGSSDTEVMLAAFERWGIRDAVGRCNGMFAFAVWDMRERSLTLARDRIGEKPLYYARTNAGLLFASELKALRVHPEFDSSIDRGALALFLRHGYVPGPHSIYSNVRKLPAGTLLTVGRHDTDEYAAPVPYWSAKDAAEQGCANLLRIGDAEAAERLEDLLSESVRMRMVADVPLGAFLSGGIDSSTVVALMQKHSGARVRTFTIGCREPGYDEAGHARDVARHLGTDHTELYVTPEEAMAAVPMLPQMYDEPFADSSQIPTFLVSRLARQHVTVSLSGDGGDELLGGYTRYLLGERAWKSFGWMPASMRSGISRAMSRVSPANWETLFHGLRPLLPRRLRLTQPSDKMQKLSDLLYAENPEAMYLRLVSNCDPASVVLGAQEPPTLLTERARWANVPTLVERMMFLDTVTYLPDDILVKLDRASMAAGLESRVPMLDHRLIEFAWRLPQHLKIRGGETKWLLRKILHKYVPRELVERPKAGFAVPVDQWLRGPLRPWAEELLDASRLRQEGWFDPAPIRRQWADHQSGIHNGAPALWSVLMFQAWLEEQSKQVPASTDALPAFAS